VTQRTVGDHTTRGVRRRALREVRRLLRGVKRYVNGRDGPYRAIVPDTCPVDVAAMLRTGRLPGASRAREMIASVKEIMP